MSSSTESGVPVDAVAALAVLDAALDQVAALELWRVGSRELGPLVKGLARVESRTSALQVQVVAEAASRGVPAEVGARNAGSWLRGLVPFTPGQSSARGGLAVELADPELAPTAGAFAAGEMSVGHAVVITRTIGALRALPVPVDEQTRGDAQALLVREARRLDAAQLGKAGKRLLLRLDPGAADRLAGDEDFQEQAREFYLHQQSNGMWHLAGQLPPLAGATLMAALDPLAAPRPAADGTPDGRPGRARMADGLHALATLSLAARAGDPAALPSRGGSATRLIVTADLATVLTQAGLPGLPPGQVSTGDVPGWPVSPLTVQTLACDAQVLPVLTDSFGRALDVGQARYSFPKNIRRAIEVRDRHCTFEGCAAKAPWCDVHHLTAFRKGGPTSEANGVLLCGRHHRFVHANAWKGRIVDGHVRWRPPDPGSTERGNAYDQEFERELRQLALTWLARNPHLNHTR